MTTYFNKLVASSLVVFSFMPVLAFAEDATPVVTSAPVAISAPTPKKATGFCANVSTVQAKLAAQIAKTETNQSEYQLKRISNVNKKEGDADAKRASGRTNADEKRVGNWTKMATNAKTDTQKAAVETYKAAISSAVAARRATVDATVKTYRDGLTAAIAQHGTTIDTAMTTFKSSIDAALSKAQADCTAGVLSKTVQQSFNSNIKDARTALAAARKAAEMSSGLTTLKKTRNDAITAAEVAFKKATDQAHADLIVALKK
jgi:hypothetical protein